LDNNYHDGVKKKCINKIVYDAILGINRKDYRSKSNAGFSVKFTQLWHCGFWDRVSVASVLMPAVLFGLMAIPLCKLDTCHQQDMLLNKDICTIHSLAKASISI